MRKGSRMSPEAVAKIRAWNLGRKASEATRAKISAIRATQRGPLMDLTREQRLYYNKIRRYHSREASLAMVRVAFGERNAKWQ